jgi:alkylhydroperoxidase/carboxymuconolactone decarboxylase family protein YurZ
MMDIGEQGNRELKEVLAKRGYLLPYHELLWLLSPELLKSYDRFYELLTLKRRHLDNGTKETVWLGILMAVEERAGRIHLNRARKAGLARAEFGDMLHLVQLARGFGAVEFVGKHWPDALNPTEAAQTYLDSVDRLSERSTLDPRARELMLIGVHSALVQREALRLHLKRAKSIGLKDEEIGEAISYVFLPCGGNVLLKAAQVLKDMVSQGELSSDGAFKIWRQA